MQNYSLLKECGRQPKPVLLKRGLSATISELLLSAEYILAAGNPNVILCERGIRSFDTTTRNVFDLSAIAVVHGLSHLPIVADPSHGTGHRDMVPAMARAAVAAGADGLLIEVHPNPERALSDGAQSLFPEQFDRMMREVTRDRRSDRSLACRAGGERGVRQTLALIAVLLVPAAVAAQTSSDPAPEIVTRAARVYRGLSGLQADFRQKLEDKRLGDQSSKGTLYQTGTRFAMRFSDPANEAVVVDGSQALGLHPE